MTRQKTGGRQAGTPNKLTRELRTSLKNILAGEIESLPAHFKQLDAKERIELLTKLLPYALPKVRDANFEISEGGLADSWT